MVSGTKKQQEDKKLILNGAPTGFEPVTYGLEESRALNNTL